MMDIPCKNNHTCAAEATLSSEPEIFDSGQGFVTRATIKVNERRVFIFIKEFTAVGRRIVHSKNMQDF